MTTLVAELVPAPDPAEACARLSGLPYRVWLDGAAGAARPGNYSFLCADPWRVITERDPDPLESLRAALAPFRTDALPGLPPFQGGAAGYIGYEFGRALDRQPFPRSDDLALPTLSLGLYDWVIAWDHTTTRAWLISTGMGRRTESPERYAAERAAMVRARLASGGLTARPAPAVPVSANRNGAHPVPELPGVSSVFTRPEYLAAVERVREYILAGDVFQVNLTQRLSAPIAGAPLDFYRRLRRVNGAPYAAFLDLDDGAAIASASPERFLKVAADGTVETRPIKGSRPRGATWKEDDALGGDLMLSEKDRAENVMIVDLLRNDLSRVCAPGSVAVPELCTLERYATVQHLVSTVTGGLASGRDAVDLLAAAFPGGSVTGAPKIRAMEIIAELEPVARGVYCGAIGYLSISGAMDTSVAIRTAVVRPERTGGGTAYFGVGGGVVADSVPAAEYAETLDKARGIVAALR